MAQLMASNNATAVAPPSCGALERSHSYTDAMLTSMEEENYQRRRLSATITEVLHSLSMLSTETAGGEEADERSTLHSTTGEESSDNNRLPMPEAGHVPPPPASSLQTPVMQRQTLSANLNCQPPTHKRELSASLSTGTGFSQGWAAQPSRHVSHPHYYYGGSASKKSRSGSFLMIQNAPHLPLSPELDAATSSALCYEGPMQAPTEESRSLFDAAVQNSGRGGSTRAAEAGASVPGVWKSHIQLPPPLFSPLLYQPDRHESDHSGGHALAVAAAANTLAMSLSVQPVPTAMGPLPQLPPPLQPELRSFDEHDVADLSSSLAGQGEEPGPRLQQRQPRPGELQSSLFFPAPPSSSTSSSSSSFLPLPPPMPLMSSPSPSPKIGRRILRMRKADAIDLALP